MVEDWLHKVLGKIGSELWFPWQEIAPIGYNGENLVTTLAPLFFIGSSLFLQVTRTAITSWMVSKIGRIRPGIYELAALERLEKSPYTYYGRNIVTTLVQSFLMDLLHYCR